MSVLFLLTNLLGCLAFTPISFTIFQLFIAPENAFLLSLGLCIVTVAACFLCQLKINSIIYRIISAACSIIFACIISGNLNLFMIILAAICIFIFTRVKKEMNPIRSMAVQIVAAAFVYNILLSFIATKGLADISAKYSNITVFISAIASVVLLIIKQTDDSRRFGSNNMGIGSTQRKNNRIFAIATLIILFSISAIGQVQNIYKLIINIIAEIIKKFGEIFEIAESGEISGTSQPNMPLQMEQAEQSLLGRIIQAITEVLILIITIAFIGFVIYSIFKALLAMVKKIINWFKKGEQSVERYYEDGHIDEKQSLYNKNINNLLNKIRQRAEDLFVREIPYNKLPNGIAKTRRLFKYYKDKAQQEGVQISKSSTSEEICRGMSDKLPETSDFNALMAKCYGVARYGEAEPMPEELHMLEDKLIR
ncbi:hypothetical protein EHE19_006335 [Ruminiclostridium herbifermentans]|uniref:DUF4129 domain-containing protein n=1 Tax=Ruminiclostridium herbifermentans TaxID=2488810 RepID=A0A4U7JAV4_9FIRM|nr:hypothetical protein [Ruminiclostridium herbifermentans]QNU68055.1 hypothetical protein EHE19_006335 [Ruminiclostridium herbifermentans]